MRTPAACTASGLAIAAAVTLSCPARADVALSTEVSPRQVEVGARFMLRLRANGDGKDQATNPELKLPAGITGSGPNVASQSQISIVNGQMTQSVGITATWVLVASRPGTYKLGPATVQTSAGRKSDRVVTVEVVPQGALQQNPPPLGGQSFDPFNMLRGFGGPGFPGFPGFSDIEPPREPELPQLPEEYRVSRPLDPIAFLRSRATPRKAVVGEQVNLAVYAYAGRGSFEPALVTEPSRDDFLAFNLMDEPRQTTGYQFEQDGQRWLTFKVAELALFPLKAGKLKAGVMTFGFGGRNYSKDPQGLQRKSKAVEIEVVEPPLDGRPPGYRVGDVGRFELRAQLEPREIPAGGSVSVVAKLEGTGNLPYTLLVPEQRGVRFLEPQIVDQVEPKRGVVQGFRTFTYVVELSEPGDIELGELTLPFYDAKAGKYGIARAELGRVKVTGEAKPLPTAGSAATQSPRLKGLITPAPELSGTGRTSGTYWPSRPLYWLALFGLPLSAGLGFALSDLGKRLRRRLAERRGSLSVAIDEALSQLDKARQASDASASASAAERALFLAIERATGLKGRGVLKSALASTLASSGIAPDRADELARLLGQCDELRFAGRAVDLATFSEQVKSACRKLPAPNKARSASEARS
jgi:BatD DUF11 like domain